MGLSRDLMIRAIANRMQEHAYGGPSVAMKRRLTTLAGEFEKGSPSFDTGVVLKAGARLVRQWRRHAHTVLVLEDAFEYEGQRYRSLTMIAARITGAHWSGPRFFGTSSRPVRRQALGEHTRSSPGFQTISRLISRVIALLCPALPWSWPDLLIDRPGWVQAARLATGGQGRLTPAG